MGFGSGDDPLRCRKLLTRAALLGGAQAARTFCTADHLAGQKDKDAVRCPAPPPPPDAKQSSNSTVRPRRAPAPAAKCAGVRAALQEASARSKLTAAISEARTAIHHSKSDYLAGGNEHIWQDAMDSYADAMDSFGEPRPTQPRPARARLTGRCAAAGALSPLLPQDESADFEAQIADLSVAYSNLSVEDPRWRIKST